MNFAPAGTAPFPVAAKMLPPIWGQQGQGKGRGVGILQQSHSYTVPSAGRRCQAE